MTDLLWGDGYAKALKAEKAAKIRATFEALCREYSVPIPIAEYRFHPDRKWRWDYAWPEHLVALEVDGGIWISGKHGRGGGITKDHEKRNAGTILGWRLLLVQPRQLCTDETVEMISLALRGAV